MNILIVEVSQNVDVVVLMYLFTAIFHLTRWWALYRCATLTPV
jgi:hypothetical protein